MHRTIILPAYYVVSLKNSLIQFQKPYLLYNIVYVENILVDASNFKRIY